MSASKKDSTFGNLYAKAVLDCIVEVAVGVGHDFVRRPNEYRDATAISPVLRKFRYRVGFAEGWPGAKERAAIYEPLFGGLGGRTSDSSPFQRLGQALRDAAIQRSDRVSPAGDVILRARFVDVANDFQSYLKTLQGAVSKDADLTTREEFIEAAKVLKDEQVAAAFSLKPAERDIWPPEGAADGNAGVLVEKITSELQLPVVTQQQFAVLHRIALHGSRTIDGVLDGGYQDDDIKVIDALTINASSWDAGLNALSK